MHISGTITSDDGTLHGFQLEWHTTSCRSADEFVYRTTSADPDIQQMLAAMSKAALVS